MKTLLSCLSAALTFTALSAPGDWFAPAQYGLFIHWGCYSVPARGEWHLNKSQMEPAEYAKYAKYFTAAEFDAKKWAEHVKRWGMRYVVFTTRHHDGYAMWDSKVNPFNCMNVGPGRDILGELVPALRTTGIRIGYYYSPANWSNPDYAGYKVKGWPRGEHPWKSEAARRRFVSYYKAELTELLEKYGAPDYLWWDGCLPEGRDLEGGTLLSELRAKYPEMIWNDRMGAPWDVRSCEQEIKPTEGTKWEACMTLNDSWGYTANDCRWKNHQDVLDMLLKCTAHGGNLLINVGPMPDGTIPAASVAILDRVGNTLSRPGFREAMELYSESVLHEGDPRGLRRVIDKAESGGTVKIAMLGGSITEGAAAGAESNRWANVFVEGWRELFPKAKVEFLNAGIGATGSTIGAFRYGRDVSPFRPDLLVVDFGVNDRETPETTQMMEAIVRHAQREEASVVMLEMIRRDGSNAQKAHIPVAKKYGVPVISFRDVLLPRLNDGTWKWNALFADGVHPNGRGHRLVGELLNVAVMEAYRKYREEHTTKPTVPEPAITLPFERAAIQPFAKIAGLEENGFDRFSERRWGEGLVAHKTGARVRFSLFCSAIGIIYEKGRKYKGVAKVTVDGVECTKRLTGHADIDWWWTPAEMIYQGARANHTVEIEVTEGDGNDATFGLCSLLTDP